MWMLLHCVLYSLLINMHEGHSYLRQNREGSLFISSQTTTEYYTSSCTFFTKHHYGLQCLNDKGVISAQQIQNCVLSNLAPFNVNVPFLSNVAFAFFLIQCVTIRKLCASRYVDSRTTKQDQN